MEIEVYKLKDKKQDNVDESMSKGEKPSNEDNFNLVKASVKDFDGLPGVWLIIGTEKKTEKETETEKETKNPKPICLQVAGTNDVGKEMQDDMDLIKDDCYPKPELVKTKWVNQFGEFQFSYFNYKDISGKWLYHFIASHYTDIKFVCVACGKQYYQRYKTGIRYELEKYVAYSTFSKFWRDSRPYNEGRPDEGKKGIKEIKESVWKEAEKEKEIIKEILEKKDNENEKGNISLEFLDNFLKIIRVTSNTNPESSKI